MVINNIPTHVYIIQTGHYADITDIYRQNAN